ncbi:MAG: NAD(P)H-dependent glycerol-3-phosphate dehydrogenase [Oscillospiraceae bacterium]|jgi:glycerol-3-phosphate dehydrogenase (NAD(P)+)
MQITVIGCGRWGSFIVWYLNRVGHSVALYGRKDSPNMRRFMATRQNEYLTLPESVSLTCDLAAAKASDIIVISINSQGLSALMEEMKPLELKNKIIVLCMKGIEIDTGRRLSQVARDAIDDSNKIAVWLGPGHVQEFVRGVPNCMVIDSENEEVKQTLVEAFSSELIRFYYGNDLIGNEIGAAAKNVIGIAAGLLDGLGLSTLKGALMSRGAREVARLISAMGGNELTAYGLCHLGDYEATIFSEHSHNRNFGELFAKGQKFDKMAEGYYTARAIIKLAREYQVELPICSSVYAILYENADPREVLESLFTRSIKKEF